MVSFLNKGRTGNFLFQLATTIGYALRHNMPYSVPSVTRNPTWNPLYFPHLINPRFDPSLPKIIVNEKEHGYQDLPFYESFRQGFNIFLDGYFQSYKYFDFCRHEIINAFKFNYSADKGTVAIHVRRGDYLLYPRINPLATREYYQQAIQTMSMAGYKVFKVFSDDIKWCTEEFADPVYKGVYFFYQNQQDPMWDLFLMANCEHTIMSNSTFAWWAAWLNQNPGKIVICPHEDNYYGPDNKHLDVSTLYPPEWIRIKYTPPYELLLPQHPLG